MIRSTDQTPGACGPGSMTVAWWKVWWQQTLQLSCAPRVPHTHTHGPRTFYAPSTHRSKNEPAGLKNRSSDETRARLNHRNSPTAELAWRQGRGGPFSASTPEAGWITQTKLAPVDQKCPAPHPPFQARPSPPPRLPTLRGRCMAPVRGASERRNAGLMETIKDDAAREGRELGYWRGAR